jgi:hypothetical protein
MQQPLATDVIVMLQGSAAVTDNDIKKFVGAKQNANY